MAEGRPELAVAALEHFSDRPDPVHTRLRLDAFLAMGDAVSAAGAVQDLPADAPLTASQQQALAAALCKAGRGNVIATLLPRSTDETGQLRRVLLRLIQDAATPEDQARAASFLMALHPALDTPLLPMEAAGILLRKDRTDLADRQLDGFNAIIARKREAGEDPFHAQEPRWHFPRDKAERVLDWLDIPAPERGPWRQGFTDASRARDAMTMRLLHDREHVTRFVQDSDSDLDSLRDARHGGIVAVSHSGLLMGFLCHLIHADLPVTILGGASSLADVLPGADRLVPIRRTDGPNAAQRRILRELKAGRLVGIAADSGKSDRMTQIVHKGQSLMLPNTVPELAYKQDIPIYWTNCHRENGRYLCRSRLVPSPAPGETMAAFTARWHHYLLDELHAICRADPLNLCLHPDMLTMAGD